MLRRVLPVAAAVAALVAIPSTASATAPQAPAENMFFAGYYGSADLLLPDGRQAAVSLYENRAASQNGWSGDLSVTVTDDSCSEDFSCVVAWGDVPLTEAQVAFSRNLDGASVAPLPMTLWSPSSSADYLAEPDAEQVTVSVLFSGTGAVARDSYTGDVCGDGSRACQSHRLSADRAAMVDFALGRQTASGSGHLSYGLSTDTAAPKFGPEGP